MSNTTNQYNYLDKAVLWSIFSDTWVVLNTKKLSEHNKVVHLSISWRFDSSYVY